MGRLLLALSLSLVTFGLAACDEEEDPPIGPQFTYSLPSSLHLASAAA